MSAIIDMRSNPSAIQKLKEITGNVLEFESQKITYSSISGHPDIFLFQDKNKIIVAPNAPENLFQFLYNEHIEYETGNSFVGETLKNSTHYNCVCSENYFFHKKNFTDASILNHVEKKTFIDLPQAYTACSLICLDEKHYVSSDRGIENVLKNSGFNCFYFNPEQIKIHGHKHGFIGGTVGIFNKTIVFNGNPELHSDGKNLINFIAECGFQTFYLHNDLLYDGGRIFFIE